MVWAGLAKTLDGKLLYLLSCDESLRTVLLAEMTEKHNVYDLMMEISRFITRHQQVAYCRYLK